MLPDADQAGTRVHRRTLLERRVALIRLAGTLARVPLRTLTLLPHRGVTHSLTAGVLATLLAGALASLIEASLAPAIAAGLAIGYGTHLVADACTPSGVPAWAPFSRRRRWVLPARIRIRTGSASEYLLLALLTALLCAATLALVR